MPLSNPSGGGGDAVAWPTPKGIYFSSPAPASSSSGFTLNRLTVSPIILGNGTIDSFAHAVTGAGTAGAVVRMGIYSSTEDSMPGALLIDAGTVDATTTGIKTIAVSQAVTSGIYWMAMVAQGATSSAWRSDVHSPVPLPGIQGDSGQRYHVASYHIDNVTGALPANFGTVTAFNTVAFRFSLRYATS